MDEQLIETQEALSRCRQLLASERDLNERLSKRDYVNITRIEIIDSEWRIYINSNTGNIKLSLQDEWTTLKIFIK